MTDKKQQPGAGSIDELIAFFQQGYPTILNAAMEKVSKDGNVSQLSDQELQVLGMAGTLLRNMAVEELTKRGIAGEGLTIHRAARN